MNATDAYSKTQMNTILSTKTDDSEVYPAIDLKANISDTYTKLQTTALLDVKADKTTINGFLDLKANASNVYTKVEIETKLAGTAQLDDVLTLYQLTTISGGHTVDLTSKASITYVDGKVATLNDRIDTKADQTALTAGIATLQDDIDTKWMPLMLTPL